MTFVNRAALNNHAAPGAPSGLLEAPTRERTLEGHPHVRGSGIAAVATVLGVVLSCLPFYTSIVPPMADLPAHVLVARIVAQYGDSTFRFSEFFTVQWNVAPTALFYLLFVPLQKIVGPFSDGRVYLTVWVVLMWVGSWALARAMGRREPWLAACVAAPLAFCWYAYNGFLPFLMSIPLFTLTVAAWLGRWKPSTKIALVGILLATIFGFHIVGAAAAGAVLGVIAVFQTVVDRDRRAIPMLAASAIPLSLVTALYLAGQQSPTAKLGYADLASQIVDVIKFTCATLDGRAGLLMLLWLGSLGIVFLWRWRDLMGTRAVLASALLLLVLSVAMPQAMGSLWPAGPRLLPFALILLIASTHWSEVRREVLLGCCALLLVGLSAFTTHRTMVIDQGYRDLLAAADLIAPGSQVLPVITDTSLGSTWTKPYLHIGSIYTAMRGGSNPYVFAVPHVMTGATPLTYRIPPASRDYAFIYDESRTPADYKGVAGSYDYVLLWGASEALTEVLRGEMQQIYRRGEATLFARPRSSTSVQQ
jgi:hypothetical protein